MKNCEFEVGDNVTLNPESSYAGRFGQLPLGIVGEVFDMEYPHLFVYWVDTDGIEDTATYTHDDLIFVEPASDTKEDLSQYTAPYHKVVDKEELHAIMDADDAEMEEHLSNLCKPEEPSYTYTLTIDELPKHTNSFVGFDKVWSDKHYNFNYKLTQKDIESGEVKIDPYFVYALWKLHEVDEFGVLMHQLKTLSRFGRKNEIMREVDALIGQSKRFKELLENK